MISDIPCFFFLRSTHISLVAEWEGDTRSPAYSLHLNRMAISEIDKDMARHMILLQRQHTI